MLCVDDPKNYCSHPDKLLKDHLKEVGELSSRNIMGAGRSDLKSFAFTAGALHDVGKFTHSFQEHLRTGRRLPCSDHALVSSLIAYGESKRYLSGTDEVKNNVYSLLTMLAVLSHHGELKGLTTLSDLLNKKAEEVESGNSCLSDQLRELEKKWDYIKSELDFLDLQVKPSISLLKEARKSVYTVRKYLSELVNEQKYFWDWYFDGLLLFSSLIDADKHSASETQYVSSPSLDPSLLIKYAESLLRSGRVQPMRDELFSYAVSTQLKDPISFLNAPTGSGKTISGSILALKRSKRRVVYSLPFISIIEQAYDVLRRVYGDSVLKYHHLSYFLDNKGNKQTDLGDEYADMERKLMVAESWDSPFVVTTFEALVNTILSSENSYLKRLHNLANSSLILDEIQAMGIEELYVVKEALEEAVKRLNIEVLFMTATNPFWEGSSPVKTKPNRYVVELELGSTVSPEEMADLACDKGDIMVEYNTIASSLKGFDVLKECTKGSKVYYLSTRVVPKERLERVKKIMKEKGKGKGVVLVTTQLVEAGVDLDFTEAMRDLGPIDSIIQAAGRVNRNWVRESGKLKVVRVKRDGLPTDFALVYGKLTEEVTLNALEGRSSFTEAEVEDVLKKYYDVLKVKFKPSNSKLRSDLLGKVTGLEFDKVKLQLIKEEPKYTVFVMLDKEAEEVYERLKDALKSKGFSRRALVKALMAKAENYIVKTWEELPLEQDSELGWYIVRREEVEKYYDEEKGLKSEKDESAIVW
ncbi:hypothetical protein DDW11_04675 [Sulfolobus sp. SCGC AB-777_G06]|nr:hypothetical protein DDW11_04675 [Sulfolobus sp. SCGC AB-777_G06]